MSDTEVAALRREFDDFRREERKSRESLEQKLWGLVAATFLLVVGYLFQQLRAVQAPVPAPAAIHLAWDLVLAIFT
jgi:hypothetical protein